MTSSVAEEDDVNEVKVSPVSVSMRSSLSCHTVAPHSSASYCVIDPNIPSPRLPPLPPPPPFGIPTANCRCGVDSCNGTERNSNCVEENPANSSFICRVSLTSTTPFSVTSISNSCINKNIRPFGNAADALGGNGGGGTEEGSGGTRVNIMTSDNNVNPICDASSINEPRSAFPLLQTSASNEAVPQRVFPVVIPHLNTVTTFALSSSSLHATQVASLQTEIQQAVHGQTPPLLPPSSSLNFPGLPPSPAHPRQLLHPSPPQPAPSFPPFACDRHSSNRLNSISLSSRTRTASTTTAVVGASFECSSPLPLPHVARRSPTVCEQLSHEILTSRHIGFCMNHRDWRQVFCEAYCCEYIDPLSLLVIRLCTTLVLFGFLVGDAVDYATRFGSVGVGMSLCYLTNWTYYSNVFFFLCVTILSCRAVWQWRHHEDYEPCTCAHTKTAEGGEAAVKEGGGVTENKKEIEKEKLNNDEERKNPAGEGEGTLVRPSPSSNSLPCVDTQKDDSAEEISRSRALLFKSIIEGCNKDGGEEATTSFGDHHVTEEQNSNLFIGKKGGREAGVGGGGGMNGGDISGLSTEESDGNASSSSVIADEKNNDKQRKKRPIYGMCGSLRGYESIKSCHSHYGVFLRGLHKKKKIAKSSQRNTNGSKCAVSDADEDDEICNANGGIDDSNSFIQTIEMDRHTDGNSNKMSSTVHSCGYAAEEERSSTVKNETDEHCDTKHNNNSNSINLCKLKNDSGKSNNIENNEHSATNNDNRNVYFCEDNVQQVFYIKNTEGECTNDMSIRISNDEDVCINHIRNIDESNSCINSNHHHTHTNCNNDECPFNQSSKVHNNNEQCIASEPPNYLKNSEKENRSEATITEEKEKNISHKCDNNSNGKKNNSSTNQQSKKKTLSFLCKNLFAKKQIKKKIKEDEGKKYDESQKKRKNDCNNKQNIIDNNDKNTVRKNSSRAPWYVIITWLSHDITLASTILVALVFWLILVPEGYRVTEVADFWKHLVNAVVIILHSFISRIPSFISHVLYVWVWSIAYCLLSVFVYIFNIENATGETGYIYIFLNFRDQPVTASLVIVIVILVGVPMVQMLIFFVTGWKRNCFVDPPNVCCQEKKNNITNNSDNNNSILCTNITNTNSFYSNNTSGVNNCINNYNNNNNANHSTSHNVESLDILICKSNSMHMPTIVNNHHIIHLDEVKRSEGSDPDGSLNV